MPRMVYGTAIEHPTARSEHCNEPVSRRSELQRATGLLAFTFLLISGAIWTNSPASLGEIPNQQLSEQSGDDSTVSVAYMTDSEGLYEPSTDSQATRSTRALLTAMVDMMNIDAIMFGHEVSTIDLDQRGKRVITWCVVSCPSRTPMWKDSISGMNLGESTCQTW